MNQIHFHLLINHLPIIGSALGSLVLVHGLWAKSGQTKIAGYNILILSAIGAVAAYLTGEGAEDAVEKIQDVSKEAIEQHGEFALLTMIALIITGLSALVSLVFTIRKSPYTVSLAIATLFLALISFGFAARTGNQGGQIRHTELSNVATNDAEGTEKGLMTSTLIMPPMR